MTNNEITPGQAAEILGVSRQTVNQWILRGKLEVVYRVGPQGIRMLRRSDVLELKKEREG